MERELTSQEIVDLESEKESLRIAKLAFALLIAFVMLIATLYVRYPETMIVAASSLAITIPIFVILYKEYTRCKKEIERLKLLQD